MIEALIHQKEEELAKLEEGSLRATFSRFAKNSVTGLNAMMFGIASYHLFQNDLDSATTATAVQMALVLLQFPACAWHERNLSRHELALQEKRREITAATLGFPDGSPSSFD